MGETNKNIHVVEVANDTDKFMNEVQEYINDGWKMSSSNCSVVSDFNGTYDTIYQAILYKNTM